MQKCLEEKGHDSMRTLSKGCVCNSWPLGTGQGRQGRFPHDLLQVRRQEKRKETFLLLGFVSSQLIMVYSALI